MAKEKTTKKTTGKKLSPYNKFMKEEISKIKQEKPELNHKEAFKAVAERWRTSPQNPKNKAT